MTVTVIALVTINEDQSCALASYLDLTEPLLQDAGARISKRFALTEDVVGSQPAQSVIVVEYPSKSAVKAVFESEGYKRAIPYRDLAFKEYSVHIVQ